MTLDQVLQEITVIEQQLARVLTEQGKIAIQQAKGDLVRQKEAATAKARQGRERRRRRRRATKPWALQIPPGTPLSFIPTAIAEAHQRLIVDLCCRISEPRDGVPQGEHNIVLRVWSEDELLWFRDAVDAAGLRDQIRNSGGRRVMSRVHFDFANPGQPGPMFHLQVGGTQHESEFCWFPDNLKLPRFTHYPLTLITACEFVVRTFFPADYERIAGEPTWIGAVHAAQSAFVEPYLRGLLGMPNLALPKRSLLHTLWNPPA